MGSEVHLVAMAMRVSMDLQVFPASPDPSAQAATTEDLDPAANPEPTVSTVPLVKSVSKVLLALPVLLERQATPESVVPPVFLAKPE